MAPDPHGTGPLPSEDEADRFFTEVPRTRSRGPRSWWRGRADPRGAPPSTAGGSSGGPPAPTTTSPTTTSRSRTTPASTTRASGRTAAARPAASASRPGARTGSSPSIAPPGWTGPSVWHLASVGIVVMLFAGLVAVQGGPGAAVDVLDVSDGRCLTTIPATTSERITSVDCRDSVAAARVVGRVELPYRPYPGTEQLRQDVAQLCAQTFGNDIARPAVPDRRRWLDDRRFVVCIEPYG